MHCRSLALSAKSMKNGIVMPQVVSTGPVSFSSRKLSVALMYGRSGTDMPLDVREHLDATFSRRAATPGETRSGVMGLVAS
ncbi:MAG: hypothetical protein RL685_3960 [Pseudomonadota bacterium]